MSGPDLAEQVTDRYPGTKVLLMSGYPDARHRRGPLVGNTELLGKPFGKRDLAQKVRAVLDGQAAQLGLHDAGQGRVFEQQFFQ